MPARGHSVGTCPAVRSRQQAVNTDYIRHARHLDTMYMDTAPGDIGPVQRRLLEFGRVQGVVVGRYAEASSFVKKFLSQCASNIASHTWMEMGSRSPVEARSIISSGLRRDFGILAARNVARFMLDRLAIVASGGQSDAYSRRAQAKANYASWQRQYENRSGFDFWDASPAAKARRTGSDW